MRTQFDKVIYRHTALPTRCMVGDLYFLSIRKYGANKILRNNLQIMKISS